MTNILDKKLENILYGRALANPILFRLDNISIA